MDYYLHIFVCIVGCVLVRNDVTARACLEDLIGQCWDGDLENKVKVKVIQFLPGSISDTKEFKIFQTAGSFLINTLVIIGKWGKHHLQRDLQMTYWAFYGNSKPCLKTTHHEPVYGTTVDQWREHSQSVPESVSDRTECQHQMQIATDALDELVIHVQGRDLNRSVLQLGDDLHL